MENFTIHTMDDLMRAVETYGFLPFFKNAIAGFSVKEHVDPALWFTDQPGPWEWKGPVIRTLGCAYGKFFEKKAAFVSREWFADFANYRRGGYDMDALYDEGLARHGDKALYDIIEQHGPVLSKNARRIGNYGKDGASGFDAAMTRLQSMCYVLTNDFVYSKDRWGRQYGWGVAQYATPEQFMGADFTDRVYRREPEQSRQLLLAHLRKLFPETPEKTLVKFLG